MSLSSLTGRSLNMGGHKTLVFPQHMDLDGRWHDPSPEHLEDRLLADLAIEERKDDG